MIETRLKIISFEIFASEFIKLITTISNNIFVEGNQQLGLFLNARKRSDPTIIDLLFNTKKTNEINQIRLIMIRLD